jgi:hypothetical protein
MDSGIKREERDCVVLSVICLDLSSYMVTKRKKGVNRPDSDSYNLTKGNDFLLPLLQ